ncbi:MAG: chemotaxis regulatin CheY-phosphate phosphatase CheZ, partial [bacterium]
NESQSIQDRVGQQLIKIIPTIQLFHDNLIGLIDRLQLKMEDIEVDKEELTKEGYGSTLESEEKNRLGTQDDVDSLLASLGL